MTSVKPIDTLTDFSSVAVPEAETEMSRRYLRLVLRWVPVAMRYFNDWPGRADCGHFFGGVLWYGQETAMSIVALAVAASSAEFDPGVAGMSAEALQDVVRKGLRYLCFTHDTGPADCVRPSESWGRKEPAGTKWGERGKGFFPESQCGRTISCLALAAALIRDRLGEEEKERLAGIAADYLARFETVEPRSGVYADTQMEENAWTAEGLASCLALLPRHDRAAAWLERARLWMFRAGTMPQDMGNGALFEDGRTVRRLCGGCFTTLPDGTAENHGFVHPSYMASAVHLEATTALTLRAYGLDVPPHLRWHRGDLYGLLKVWCDNGGAPHCVQGMDWPYFAYMNHCLLHAAGDLLLHDVDAPLLERRALSIIERCSAAHGGRMVTEDTVAFCHGQQDPALMRERFACALAQAGLLHRLLDPGGTVPGEADMERRIAGVHLYAHGGAVLHRHARGINSLSWRNRTMALPSTREGERLIGPAGGSLLATFEVRDRPASARIRRLKIRESADRVAVLLEEEVAQSSVLREVLFASLPDGRCLTFERLRALEDVTVERVRQGCLSVINDGLFGDFPDRRGRRRIFWAGGQREFAGYPLDSDRDDVTVELGPSRWVNIDDRCGLVFEGTGRALYRNRHRWEVWHASEDQLVLSECAEPITAAAGTEIARLAALWCPEQTHAQTARESLLVRPEPGGVLRVDVRGFACVCNLGSDPVDLPVPARPLPPGEPAIWEA